MRGRMQFRDRKDKPITLLLTPMIDMFTNLLIFCLINFQVGDIEILPENDLTLPSSISDAQPRMATKVVVSQKIISVEGAQVCEVKDGGVGNQYKNGMIITPLSKALEARRNKTEYIESKNPTAKFEGTVLLQADKDITYRLLNEVMYTAGKLGFLNFILLSYQKDST